MTKSIRTLALTAALVLSAVPMFANRMGTNPHPQADFVTLSLGDYADIVLTLLGL
jgi:hypothetical protein